MTTTAELIAAWESHWNGTPWHGSPLREIVAQVPSDLAFVRPAPDVRGVAELLGHLTAWIDIVRERLEGAEVEVTPERDFPSVEGRHWSELVADLEKAFRDLRDVIARRSDTSWEELVPGKEYSARWMLDGLMHHDTYHAAQIAIVRRIVAGSLTNDA